MRSWYYPGGSHLVLFAPDHIDIDIDNPVSAVLGVRSAWRVSAASFCETNPKI